MKAAPIHPSVEWFIWRPVKAGLATLREIETHWSLDDLLDSHFILDATETAQAQD